MTVIEGERLKSLGEDCDSDRKTLLCEDTEVKVVLRKKHERGRRGRRPQSLDR